MDTSEQTIVEKKAPAKKKIKRKAAPRVEKLPPADGIYTGLTVTNCCDKCGVDACVISGKPYCAHPRKGGLHAAQISDPVALKRLNHAKRILGQQMLDARSE
jgi:hypothetical protein